MPFLRLTIAQKSMLQHYIPLVFGCLRSNPTLYRPLLMKSFRCCSTIPETEYDRKADGVLAGLAEYFDSFPDWLKCDKDFDVSCSMGVLTVNVGKRVGVYVINKQTPNRQIWLSSPMSGPKRYDIVGEKWIYSHDGKSLDALLNEEFRNIFCCDEIDFSKHMR
ncbi:hypothetical protein AB6A40_003363 [Gnathostoma spinigerum]|uniref:ferroxidase n=1 Tax=Gnathostoma spinigerum TaxID=75299 RepID=A0ABD6EH39_9BILA